MAYERKCILCGKTYKYCPHCRDYDSLPKWMTMFDRSECKEIFDAVSEFNFGNISALEAKNVLDKYPNEDYSLYTQITQKSIKEIDSKVNQIKKRATKSPKSIKENNEEKNEVIKK